MMILHVKVMAAIRSPQTAPLGVLALDSFVVSFGSPSDLPLISLWCCSPLTSSGCLPIHGLALVAGGRPSALEGFARSASGRCYCRRAYPNAIG
jgi:hypothetical protein